MPAPLHDTRFRVLAIGMSTATLILWLSSSFWLDAWHQSADVRRLERLAPLSERLRDLKHDLADERTTTLGVVDVAAGGRLVLVDDLSTAAAIERLHAHRRHFDDAFENVVTALADVSATPSLLEHLQMLPETLEQAIARLETRRRALVRDRARFDGTLADETVRTADDRRVVPAALRLYASSSRLVHELETLQDGIRLEPHRLMPEVEALRRARTGLRDMAEAESARAALQGLAPTYVSRAGSGGSLERMLDEAVVRSRIVAARLDMLAGERRLDGALRTELRSLVDDHRRLLASWFPISPSINAEPRRRALELDARIERMIDVELERIEMHGYRRLSIDSLLVASCLLIVIASLRLLGSISHQARHDPLSGLPNRAHLERSLHRSLARERERDTRTALLMIDVDDFESVNDTFGHDVGDELIRQLAARLQARLEEPGLLAALGGDEFALLLWIDTDERARHQAERLRGACDEPFEVRGAALRITLSIGMSTTADHDRGEPGLMQRASIAMRQAKDAGKDRVLPFSRELAEQKRARLELEKDLRLAVERGQLELHYQPKVDTRSGRVLGAEALIRWRHPEHGLVPPRRFVPLAENCGLMVSIGTWVLDEALAQTASWHRSGRLDLQISVNVSAQQLVADDFMAGVDRALASSGLAPGRLELEVTESVGMMDMALVVERLERLRTKGIRIAIDDFGTDYSSLQYLEDLPLDTLKIDRAFVVKLDRSEQGRSLVNTIVLMAKSFGLETVAEGVETREQLDKVVALGCDQVQGYFHSRPVPADELPDVVARIDADAGGGRRLRAA